HRDVDAHPDARRTMLGRAPEALPCAAREREAEEGARVRREISELCDVRIARMVELEIPHENAGRSLPDEPPDDRAPRLTFHQHRAPARALAGSQRLGAYYLDLSLRDRSGADQQARSIAVGLARER